MTNVQEVIQPVAPELAAAMSGPLADVATRYLSDKLIGDNKAEGDQEGLEELVKNTDNLRKIKEINSEFKKEMQGLGIDVLAQGKSDRAASGENERPSQKPQIWISVLFLMLYFLILLAVFVVEVSDTLNMAKGDNSMMGELQILLGVLTAGVGQILSFWFGGVLKKAGTANN